VSTHITYGQLKLKCAAGHELGAIVATRNGLYRLEHVLKDADPIGAKPLAIGQPLRAVCKACQLQNRTPYFQAHWSQIEDMLRQEITDTHSEHRSLTLTLY
jgi:hypothetical protein